MVFKLNIPLIFSFLIIISFVSPIKGAPIDVESIINRAEKATEEKDIPLAIAMYSQLIKEYKDNFPKEEQLKYADLFQKGYDLCWSQNRFLEALEFATYGLKASQKGGDVPLEIRFLGLIGNLHSLFEDNERAIYYYKTGYKLALDHDLPNMQFNFIISIVGPSLETGNINQAKEYYRKMKMVQSSDSLIAKFYNDYLQGLIAESENYQSLARYYHKLALETARENNMKEYMMHELWEIGKTFQKEEILDSATYYYNNALDCARSINMSGHLPKIYESLSEVAKIQGDSIAYVRYNNSYKEAIGSLFNFTSYNSKRNQLVEYEEMVKDTTIDGLNKRVWIQNTVLICVGVILLIVVIFYILLWKRIQALKYANNKLIDRNHELIKAEELNRKLMDQKLETTSADNNENEILEANEMKDNQTPYLNPDQVEILLNRIRKIFNQSRHPFDQDFSLNMLAELVKSNTKYVSWVINETYSKNFKTLLNEIRVRKASELLEDHENYSNYTIQAISEEVGYKSSNSFIIAFKKLVGMTPSVYQKLSLERSGQTPTPDS